MNIQMSTSSVNRYVYLVTVCTNIDMLVLRFCLFLYVHPLCQVADRVGVYVGSSAPDYMGILLDPQSTSSTITGDENLGSQRAMLANKISDFFGFKGLD